MAFWEVVAEFGVLADRHEERPAIFNRAVGPTRPKLMRLGAMQTLSDLGDPRARPLLQSMTNDPDPAIREQVRRLLKETQH